MIKTIIPLNDRVLVEPIDVESTSAGGIVLTGDATFKFNHGKVLAVGEGRNMPSGRIPIDVSIGDVVIYGDVQNTIEDRLEGKKVLLIVEQAIIAIVKEVT
jgi:chaperonin GroES